MKKRKLFLASVMISLVIILVWIFVSRNHYNQDKPEPIVVAVSLAQYIDLASSINLIGTVVSDQGIDISSQISGIVTSIHFTSGEDVKQGDLLVVLSNDDIKADLEQSQAKLVLAKQDYQRYQTLKSQGTVSGEIYDNYSSQFKSAFAKVVHDQALLAQTYIRAPFSGHLGIRDVNIGQYISPGMPLVNIESVTPLYVDFNIPERYINQVNRGDSLEIRCDAFLGKKVSGKIVALGAKIDLDTRTLPVRAMINDHADIKIIPGMYVNINLFISDASKVLVIPQSAVSFDPEGEYVYQLIGNHVKKTKIKAGEWIGDSVVITKNLKVNDVVVSAGQVKLYPEAVVKAVPYENNKEPL